MNFKLLAACAFGLEAIVKRELLSLGYESKIVQPGKVEFEGDELAICRTNIWLRVADRIAIVVDRFAAKDFDQLFETTKAVDWPAWLPVDANFPVSGRSRNSTLTSVPACQRSVKRAIVDCLKSKYDAVLDESGARFPIEVAIDSDQATLTIDTTGPSLHKRGYRKFAGTAPLKETLAAALVMLSFWNPQRPLVDPFCGSGTIPIEAALIGCNIAPGMKREFTAESWPQFAESVWNEARQEAQQLVQPPQEEKIIGTDRDADVLKLARRHAELAGVSDCIHWQQKSFDQLLSRRQYGCTIMNPPYGDRLQQVEQLHGLYQSIPAVLHRLPTWSHFILTNYPKFEAVIQRRADRRRKLFNGRIECTYYQFHGPQPPRQPIVNEGENVESSTGSTALDAVSTDELKPVFGGLSNKSHEQAELFASRLSKRARHLRRFPTKRGITCYRLYEKDIPEIPLVVDRYEDHLHVVEYQRPHDRDRGEHAAWLDLMTKTAASTLGVERRRVFVKPKLRSDSTGQLEKVADQRYQILVHEGGLRFWVNLSDYVDTGLFLDHRVTRSMVREEARNKRFLNLFAYTGAFSVYAADGGAVATTTVDWSKTYLDWAAKNMEENQFTDPHHAFVREDSLSYIRRLPHKPLFDLVVVDPPTYSNSKRSEQDWDVQRDHVALLNEVVLRLSTGGVIYFSTNSRRFKLDEAGIANVGLREISKQTIPEDYRNRRIHRCWVIHRSS